MVNKDTGKIIISMCKVELNINLPNENNKTALHKAAYNNHLDIIQLLLVNGADPGLYDENGSMPLDLGQDIRGISALASWDQKTTIRLLDKYEKQKEDEEFQILNSGFVSNDLKRKIIKYACQRAREGDVASIKKLISKKRITIEAQDENGSSILAIAVWSQQYNGVNSLIDSFNADVNTQDYNGWTPLIIAAHQNNLKMAKLLCECGAEANKRNLKGLSAIDLAKSDEMEHFLQKRKQMSSCFDFENLLKLSMSKKDDLHEEYNDYDELEDEVVNFQESTQLEETLAQAIDYSHSKKENELIQRTIMNMSKGSISNDIISSPRKRKRRLSKRKVTKFSIKH